MADITITLSDDEMRRLRRRANDERRSVENMALYLVAKALMPKARPKPKAPRKPKAKTVRLAIERLDRAATRIQNARQRVG